MRNLHVPLPEPLYRKLRELAIRSRRPATAIARDAISEWLNASRRAQLHQEIARYASECAGTKADLDPVLEQAGIEHLLEEEKEREKGAKK